MIMVLLNYLSVARFQGPDSGDFLHAQLSADIAALESGDATFACYCSPRGQVLGLLLVCRQDSEYLVAAAAGLLPAILTRLRMFVLRSRVEFSIQPGMGVFGIGPDDEISSPGVFQPGESGLHYFFTDRAAETNDPGGCFKALEIRSHATWLGPETTEKFIPQMLGFDQIGAVSYTKGCYPGQEIVARARYLGKVKRKALVLEIRGKFHLNPAERVELRREESRSKGIVIDSAPDSGTGTLVFIVAPEQSGAGPNELVYRDQVYRCATI